MCLNRLRNTRVNELCSWSPPCFLLPPYAPASECLQSHHTVVSPAAVNPICFLFGSSVNVEQLRLLVPISGRSRHFKLTIPARYRFWDNGSACRHQGPSILIIRLAAFVLYIFLRLSCPVRACSLPLAATPHVFNRRAAPHESGGHSTGTPQTPAPLPQYQALMTIRIQNRTALVQQVPVAMPGDHEILVQVKTIAINPTDWKRSCVVIETEWNFV
jgi:hypothetical protein